MLASRAAAFRKIGAMALPTLSQSRDEVLVDYTSPGGSLVTSTRGTLVVGALQQLKDLSLYERYLELSPREHRESVGHVLAVSWVPIEVVTTHCRVCDELALSDRQLIDMGQRLGVQMFENFLGSALRAVRGAGMDSAIWFALRQIDRVWPRIYAGGSCCVLKRGPKDAVLEVLGLPVASSRTFRLMHHAFLQGLSSAITKASVVRSTRPRVIDPHTLATAFSWV
jgi:hypothetical protein